MNPDQVADWMLLRIEDDSCLYQDDVVDYLIRSDAEDLLRENSDGNQVLSTKVLTAFRKLTPDNVVWVLADKYWRFRVTEDDVSRTARG
jgi:hypothetical protein